MLLKGGWRVGLGLSLGRCLGWSALSAVAGFQLLELVGCEDRGKLLAGLLVNGPHLLLHDYGGDGFVVGQRGDLAVAVGQDGFELRGLIGRQVEFFAELCGFTLGVVRMVMLRRGGGGGILLLGKGETARESQGEGGGEQKAVHGWCSL